MPAPQSPNDLTRHQLDELDQLLQRMLKLPLANPSPEPAAAPAPVPRPELPAGWRVDGPMPTRSAHLSELAPRPVAATVALQAVEATLPVVAESPQIPQWGPDPLARYNTTPEAAEPSATREPLRLFGPPSADSGIPPSTMPNSTTTGTLRGVDAPATPVGFRSRLAELTDPIPEPMSLPEPTIDGFGTSSTSAEPVTRKESSGLPWPLLPLQAVNWVLEMAFGLFGPVGQAFTSPLGKNVLAFLGFLLIAASAVWCTQGLGYIKLPIAR